MAALRLIVLLAAGAASLFAQIDCTATGNSIPVRAEAVTDLLGDIEIRCVKQPGFDPGSAYVEADFRLFLNTNTTNRLLGTAGADATDAVLTINGVGGRPTRTSTIDPASGVPFPQYGVAREEFIPGSGNLVIWAGVRVPIPEADRGDGTRFPLRTTIRITNLRGNISQLGVPTGSAATILIFALATQLGSPIRISTPAPAVGTARNSLLVSVTTPANSTPAIGLQCQSQNVVGGSSTFTVRAEEVTPTAFRALGTPGVGPLTGAVESGYPTPDSGGGADSGTRLQVRFSNVNQGVSLGVPTTILSGSLILRLTNADFNGAGPFSPVAGGPLAAVDVSFGFGQATYEVVAANPEAVEIAAIPVTVGYSANPAQNLPSLGTMTVSVSLAPVSTVTTRSRTAPVPRFVDTSIARNAFAVNACAGQPVIQAVEPASVTAGSPGFTLRIAGVQFSTGAVLVFEGVALATRPDGSGRLAAELTAAQLARPRSARIQVRNADGTLSNDAALVIAARADAPVLSRRGVVSAGRFQLSLAPGGIASAYGANLAASVLSASTTPLPRVLGGTRVFVDNREAPLYFVSPGQVNFQTPFETRLGSVEVYVSRDGVLGAPETAVVERLAPAVLPAGEGPAVVHSDYRLVTEEQPAQPGEDLVVFGTGGGGFRNAPESGARSPGAPPSESIDVTQASLGGFPAAVAFSGLAPDLVGVTQWNVRMPSVIPAGRQQFLEILFPNSRVSTNAVISVRSNSAPADQARFRIIGPATARRGQNFMLTYSATLPGTASGAYVCTLLGSSTQPFVPSTDAAFDFRATIEGGSGTLTLEIGIPANFPLGTFFLGIQARDSAGASPLPEGFMLQVTN